MNIENFKNITNEETDKILHLLFDNMSKIAMTLYYENQSLREELYNNLNKKGRKNNV